MGSCAEEDILACYGSWIKLMNKAWGSSGAARTFKNAWLLVGDRKILFLRVALFVATERSRRKA